MVFAQRLLPRVHALARETLPPPKFLEAEALAKSLLDGPDSSAIAISQLRHLVGVTPKRPIYYLNNEIGGLPGNTRNVMRYAGDYVDQLIKWCAYEKNVHKWIRNRALTMSLGSNLKKLNGKLPRALQQALEMFNAVLYVPAKHEWDVKNGPHLFSATEAVFGCFVMKTLESAIISLSYHAAMYANDETVEYYTDT